MPSYSRSSNKQLRTVRPELRRIFREVLLRGYDHAILEGHRSQHDQHEKFIGDLSGVDWPNSKHNATPSNAVDVRPYIPSLGYPEDHKYFYRFAGQVEAIAQNMGYKLRWGGDWDSDRDMDDQRFNDLFHFEYVREL